MSEPSASCFSIATLSIRLLGLVFLVLGLWQGAANLIDGWMEFDPTYLSYFLRSQLLRPALALALGLGLIASSRPLARLMVRNLS